MNPSISVHVQCRSDNLIEVIRFAGETYGSELRCFQRGADFQVSTTRIGPKFQWQPVGRLPEFVAMCQAMHEAAEKHPADQWAASPDPDAEEVSPLTVHEQIKSRE